MNATHTQKRFLARAEYTDDTFYTEKSDGELLAVLKKKKIWAWGMRRGH